jgi:hypothetical protein
MFVIWKGEEWMVNERERDKERVCVGSICVCVSKLIGFVQALNKPNENKYFIIFFFLVIVIIYLHTHTYLYINDSND